MPDQRVKAPLSVSGAEVDLTVSESQPITAVPEASVDAIHLPVSRLVWAMVPLQRLTEMRPPEACWNRT